MPEISYIKNYTFSRDYIALVYLARKQSVILICHGSWLGKTLYQREQKRFAAVDENEGTIYINLCEEQNFINALQVMKVQFIMPQVSAADLEAIENLKQIQKILEEK